MKPEEILWSGLPGWCLENDKLRVITVPSLGGKLVSVFDKHAGREWLALPTKPLIAPVPYAASFLEFSLSGWDEMLPTIIACQYPLPGSLHGKHLPDHGEVWTLPWEVVCSSEYELILAMTGIALPYRFTRRLSPFGSAGFCLDYNLANLTPEPLAYLWAAHPLFNCDASTRIILPSEVKQVINVQESEIWGSAGGIFAWPQAAALDGSLWQLDIPGLPNLHDSRKFYLSPEQHVSWAMLAHDRSSRYLRMEWDVDRVPYLGIWVDEGCYTKQTTLALEPSTAYYDSLEEAFDNQRVSILPPEEYHSWQLRVFFGSL
jgi:galactose mutarotase-like enzyme